MKSVPIESVYEPFTVIKLADGSTIKMRLVIMDIKRNDVNNPDGSPNYNINSQVLTYVTDWKENNPVLKAN